MHTPRHTRSDSIRAKFRGALVDVDGDAGDARSVSSRCRAIMGGIVVDCDDDVRDAVAALSASSRAMWFAYAATPAKASEPVRRHGQQLSSCASSGGGGVRSIVVLVGGSCSWDDYDDEYDDEMILIYFGTVSAIPFLLSRFNRLLLLFRTSRHVSRLDAPDKSSRFDTT